MSEGIHISEEALSSLSDDAATGESVRTDLNVKQRSQMRAVWEWVFVVVVAIGAAMFIRLFLFQQYYIDGPSMQTTLMPQDRVLVNKMSYKLHDIHRGDVIVFDRVTNEVQHDDLIKRVLGLPGETLKSARALFTSMVCRFRSPISILNKRLKSSPARGVVVTLIWLRLLYPKSKFL